MKGMLLRFIVLLLLLSLGNWFAGGGFWLFPAKSVLTTGQWRAVQWAVSRLMDVAEASPEGSEVQQLARALICQLGRSQSRPARDALVIYLELRTGKADRYICWQLLPSKK
jgi:hypothetical protein